MRFLSKDRMISQKRNDRGDRLPHEGELLRRPALGRWLLFFFGIRIFTSIIIGDPFSGDNEYYALALNIMGGNYSGIVAGLREPLYLLLIIINIMLFGYAQLESIYFSQAILSTGSVYLIYLLGKKILGPREAWIAFLWAGFYPFFVWSCTGVQREALVIFLYLLFALNFFNYLFPSMGSGGKYAIFWASAYVFLLFTDMRYLYLLPIIFVIIGVIKKKSGLKTLLIISLLLFLVWIPFGVYNYVIDKQLIPVRNASWQLLSYLYETVWYYPRATAMIGSNRADETGEGTPLCKKITAALHHRDILPNDINYLIDVPYLPAKYAYLYHNRWGIMRFNFKRLFTPFCHEEVFALRRGDRIRIYKYRQWPLVYNIGSIIGYGILLPFFFIGVFIIARRSRQVLFPLFSLILGHTAVHMVTFGLPRYRIPIDGLIIIIGSAGIAYCLGYRDEEGKT